MLGTLDTGTLRCQGLQILGLFRCHTDALKCWGPKISLDIRDLRGGHSREQ